MTVGYASKPDTPETGTELSTEIAYDEARLLYWLRQRNLGEYVITTTRVAWDEFKSKLVQKDGRLIYPGTGEAVDGVTLAACPAEHLHPDEKEVN
ncbi:MULTISPECIES: hypothetical protein [Oscillospiraceae]|uniref:Uncharacterized protein n=1 Tax=Pseudobacteroides cellulosolvens ATCC 35603 = DSM 2933 TaxID=398512 RepID=A0A0L6JTQ4_9FIRM|nr:MULTISPECIES: hypothetical protein [Oscillospiraceae]KNY29070.1 hypothetical protein Bccel_4344 [Pseudobacteroides cellulosolvens ATCC 35603 = DSM 2933]